MGWALGTLGVGVLGFVVGVGIGMVWTDRDYEPVGNGTNDPPLYRRRDDTES